MWKWLMKLLRELFPEKEYEKPELPLPTKQQKFYPDPKPRHPPRWKPTPPRAFGPDWRKL